MEEIKKALKIRKAALIRLNKEYSNYLIQKNTYDMDSETDPYKLKKLKQFYDETTSALNAVKNNIVQYRQQVEAYLEEHETELAGAQIQEELDGLMSALETVNLTVPKEITA